MRSRPVVTGCLLLISACGPATTGTAGRPTTPAPARPGNTPAPTPTAPSPRGAAVTYRPVRAAGYTIHRLDSLVLQLPGGATQEQLLERTAFLHVSIVDGATPGTYRATIVLDSLQAWMGGIPVPADSVARAQGTRWTATLTPSGHLADLRADRASTFGEQVATSLRLLFPTLPPGGVRAGMAWTDSTRFPLTADAFEATEQAVTAYRATEGEGSSPATRKALKLESTGTYRRSGKRMQFNQELEMTAAGTRRGVFYLRDGVLVSAEGNDAGDMTITVPAVGQTVPVKQSGSYSITARP